MKKGIALLFIMLFATSLGQAKLTYASTNDSLANDDSEILYEINYQKNQLNNDTLYEMALDNRLVNDETTQVSVYYREGIKVVKIEKLLNKTVFNDGEEIENYSIMATGVKEETTSGASVKITQGFDYEKRTFKGMACYRATRFFSTPTLTDSRFRLISLKQNITASGQGYRSDGVGTYVNETSNISPISNPVSGKIYPKSTGFLNFISPNDGSGLGTRATLTYRRIDGTTLYTFSFPTTI